MEQLSTAVQPVNTWHSADSSIAPDGGDVTGRRPRARVTAMIGRRKETSRPIFTGTWLCHTYHTHRHVTS